jgi:transposase, IS30 family
MEKQYVHLSRAERDEIFRLLKGGISQRAIAKQLGRSPATVSREIKRNGSTVHYLPDTAQALAHKRRRRGTFKIDTYPELRLALLKGLQARWSPEQIAASCHGKTTVCHETIYRYIYHSPFSLKLGLYELLCREKPRRTKRRYRKSRSKIPNRTSIHQRPTTINNRNRYHHWEADLMHFGKQKHSLITAIERKSRFVLIINNPDGKAAKGVAQKLAEAIAPYAPKSITLDNGLEFAQHQTLPSKTFFCDPYSSWQKGSIENANGIIRRFLPKSYKGHISNKLLESIQNTINNTPRKILGWKTPAQLFNRCTSI